MLTFDPATGVTMRSAAPITEARLQVYTCGGGCEVEPLAVTALAGGEYKLAPLVGAAMSALPGSVVVLQYTTANDCCQCWRYQTMQWPACPQVTHKATYTPTTTATPGVVAAAPGQPGGPIRTC